MRRIWVLTKHTYLGFTGDNCTQQAAAISYYVLFSIIPLAIFVLSVFSAVFATEDLRRDIVDRVLDVVPLTADDGRQAVQDTLDDVRRVSGPIAALSLIAMLWTASAVFASVRRALNAVWRVGEGRPFFRAKLIDFAQVGVLSIFLLTSMVLTGVLRAIREVSAEHVGPLANESPLWEVPPVVLPAVLSCAAFFVLYRIVPAARPEWRAVIPGAIFATILFEALKNTFAIYVANFNNYDVVYGSLGALLLFLLYTFLASNILLLGAELSRTFARMYAGELAEEISPTRPGPSMAEQALRAFKGLFVRQ
ncbi:MAG: YihY/virulence factor BrkB family protein [Dehalococcoidia bacterium]